MPEVPSRKLSTQIRKRDNNLHVLTIFRAQLAGSPAWPAAQMSYSTFGHVGIIDLWFSTFGDLENLISN